MAKSEPEGSTAIFLVSLVFVVGFVVGVVWLVFWHPVWALVLIGVPSLVAVCYLLWHAEPQEREKVLVKMLVVLAGFAVIIVLRFILVWIL